MPSSLAAHLQYDTQARQEASMFVELDTRHDARYSVSLKWDRDSGQTQIVVADSGDSSVLVFPVPGEKAGKAFRHQFRYAPGEPTITASRQDRSNQPRPRTVRAHL